MKYGFTNFSCEMQDDSSHSIKNAICSFLTKIKEKGLEIVKVSLEYVRLKAPQVARCAIIASFMVVSGGNLGSQSPNFQLDYSLEKLKQKIKKLEGLKLQAYYCPTGHKTIGYGHIIRKGESLEQGITTHQADSILHSDLMLFKDWVEAKLPHLKGNEVLAVTSFCYCFGTTKFQKSSLYRLLLERKPIENEIVKWAFINGKKSNRLYDSRLLELAVFKSENFNDQLKKAG